MRGMAGSRLTGRGCGERLTAQGSAVPCIYKPRSLAARGLFIFSVSEFSLRVSLFGLLFVTFDAFGKLAPKMWARLFLDAQALQAPFVYTWNAAF